MKKYLAGSLLLILVSCYEEPTNGNEAIRLLQGTWKLSLWTSSPAYRYSYSNGTTKSFTDLFDLYIPCRHDDEYVFEVDTKAEIAYEGAYIYREGKLACGSDDIIESSTWFFDDLSNHIYFELPGSEPFSYKISRIYSIEKLTENQLVFTYKVQSGSTIYNWQEEYTRK